jgi:hypothetical protein
MGPVIATTSDLPLVSGRQNASSCPFRANTDSEEKQERASDNDAALVDSLKVIDPKGRLEKQTWQRLFDHLVGAGEQARWNS